MNIYSWTIFKRLYNVNRNHTDMNSHRLSKKKRYSLPTKTPTPKSGSKVFIVCHLHIKQSLTKQKITLLFWSTQKMKLIIFKFKKRQNIFQIQQHSQHYFQIQQHNQVFTVLDHPLLAMLLNCMYKGNSIYTGRPF